MLLDRAYLSSTLILTEELVLFPCDFFLVTSILELKKKILIRATDYYIIILQLCYYPLEIGSSVFLFTPNSYVQHNFQCLVGA